MRLSLPLPLPRPKTDAERQHLFLPLPASNASRSHASHPHPHPHPTVSTPRSRPRTKNTINTLALRLLGAHLLSTHQLASLSALSRCAKHTYVTLASALWSRLTLTSDEQLKAVLSALAPGVLRRSLRSTKRFFKKTTDEKSDVGQVELDLSDPLRMWALVDSVDVLTFEYIPSPRLCARLPRYIAKRPSPSPSSSPSSRSPHVNVQDDQSHTYMYLFANAQSVRFSESATKHLLRYGSQLLSLPSHALTYSWEPTKAGFVHLASPTQLCVVLPYQPGGYTWSLDTISAFRAPNFFPRLEHVYIHGLDARNGLFGCGVEHTIYLCPFRARSNAGISPLASVETVAAIALEAEAEATDEFKSETLAMLDKIFKTGLRHYNARGTDPRTQCPYMTRWTVRYPPSMRDMMRGIEEKVLEDTMRHIVPMLPPGLSQSWTALSEGFDVDGDTLDPQLLQAQEIVCTPHEAGVGGNDSNSDGDWKRKYKLAFASFTWTSESERGTGTGGCRVCGLKWRETSGRTYIQDWFAEDLVRGHGGGSA